MSTPASEPWISVSRAPGHALDPPDISVIQDICEIEGHAFAAMELLLGQTFRHHIEGRRFPICLGSQVVTDYGDVVPMRDLT